jgi:hypothetical protein
VRRYPAPDLCGCEVADFNNKFDRIILRGTVFIAISSCSVSRLVITAKAACGCASRKLRSAVRSRSFYVFITFLADLIACVSLFVVQFDNGSSRFASDDLPVPACRPRVSAREAPLSVDMSSSKRLLIASHTFSLVHCTRCQFQRKWRPSCSLGTDGDRSTGWMSESSVRLQTLSFELLA